MKRIVNFLKEEFNDFSILLRNIPSGFVSIFVLSLVCANITANKELISFKYLALDAGFAFSWIMFLCMDVICKHFGAKASIKLSTFALSLNLLVCFIFFLISKTPGMWGEYYTTENQIVNDALNKTIGGSWYIVLGSSTAFIISSILNSILNSSIGHLLKKDNFLSFALRSYISTFISQIADNFIFATIVSKFFFGWTWTQVIMCSLVAAVFELSCEMIFGALGYKIVKSWKKNNVGREYLEEKSKKTN